MVAPADWSGRKGYNMHRMIIKAQLEGMRYRLIELIIEKSYQCSDEATFKLVCGLMSRFYFNCKPTMLSAEAKPLLGELGFASLRGLGLVAVGGLELGSIPLSGAISHTSQRYGEPIDEFIVRKNEKDHGIPAKIESSGLKEGDWVAVVDDVVTTGGSTIQAINACEEKGLIVKKVLVLVDRQEMNGRENILARVPVVEALVTRDEVVEIYQRLKHP